MTVGDPAARPAATATLPSQHVAAEPDTGGDRFAEPAATVADTAIMRALTPVDEPWQD
jgi:hypothetical protein